MSGPPWGLVQFWATGKIRQASETEGWAQQLMKIHAWSESQSALTLGSDGKAKTQ